MNVPGGRRPPNGLTWADVTVVLVVAVGVIVLCGFTCNGLFHLLESVASR